MLQWIARGELDASLAVVPLANCDPTELRTIAVTGIREARAAGLYDGELEEIDGHRCAVIWNDPADPTTGVPTGQEPTAEGVPAPAPGPTSPPPVPAAR